MPIYAYKCESCGNAMDALQKISDPVLVDCPTCGKPALKKQLTAAGFQLKGSGWYATDFKGGAAPAADAPAAEGATDSQAPGAPANGAPSGDTAAGKSGEKSGEAPPAAAAAATPAAPAAAKPSAPAA